MNLQIKPYRSVKGGSDPLNLEAVRRVGTALDDWKYEPSCWRERRTVGGRFSSATMDDSSTEGRSERLSSRDDELTAEPSPAGPADKAVVGNGREEEARLRRDGRIGRLWSEPLIEYALARMVALDTEENRERPSVAVALNAESP